MEFKKDIKLNKFILKWTAAFESYKVLPRFLGREAAYSLVTGIMGSVLLAFSEFAVAGFIQIFLITINLLPENSSTTFGKTRFELWQSCLLLLTLVSARSVGQYLTNVSSGTSQLLMQRRLKEVLAADILYGKRIPKLKKVHSLTAEMFPKSSAFSYNFSVTFSLLLQIFALSLAIFFVAWKEALAGLFAIGLIGVIVLKINKNIFRLTADIPTESEKVSRNIQFIASNWLITFLLKTTSYEYKKLKNSIIAQSKKEIHAQKLSSLAASIPPFLGTFALIIIIILSQKVFETSSSRLLIFLYLFIRFVQILASAAFYFGQSISQLSTFNETLKYFRSAEPNFRMAVNNDQDENNGEINASKDSKPCKIEIINLSFSHEKRSQKIFEHFSYTIEPGQQIGIVGPSGSGKSTLLNLILGLQSPKTGQIFVNEMIPFDSFNSKDISIGYAGPDPFLFEGTVRENIAYGLKRTASDEELINALIDLDLVSNYQDGLNYLEQNVNSSSSNFSTGQKQRISFARVLIKKPSLAVFDEVSANLDDASESRLANAMEKLRTTSTVLIVSHRPGILINVDSIVRLPVT